LIDTTDLLGSSVSANNQSTDLSKSFASADPFSTAPQSSVTNMREAPTSFGGNNGFNAFGGSGDVFGVTAATPSSSNNTSQFDELSALSAKPSDDDWTSAPQASASTLLSNTSRQQPNDVHSQINQMYTQQVQQQLHPPPIPPISMSQPTNIGSLQSSPPMMMPVQPSGMHENFISTPTPPLQQQHFQQQVQGPSSSIPQQQQKTQQQKPDENPFDMF
jgi:hypothetical protein